MRRTSLLTAALASLASTMVAGAQSAAGFNRSVSAEAAVRRGRAAPGLGVRYGRAAPFVRLDSTGTLSNRQFKLWQRWRKSRGAPAGTKLRNLAAEGRLGLGQPR